jgi:hypothetical protein
MSKPCLLGGVTGFSNFPYKVFEGFSNLTSSLPDALSRYGAPLIAGSHFIGIQFLRFQIKISLCRFWYQRLITKIFRVGVDRHP